MRRPRALFLLLLLLLLLGLIQSPEARAAMLRVPDDFPSISAALPSAVPGDTVAVRAGTYFDSFVPVAGVSVLGGYDPSFTVRDPEANETILSSTQRIVTCDGCGTDVDTVIDGFTLIGGTSSDGGLVLLVDSPLTLSNNRFDGADAGRGGSVYLIDSSALLRENVFTGSSSSEVGGALAIFGGDDVRVERCRFEGNTAGASGGAIFADNASNLIIRDCEFIENECAAFGGAVLCQISTGIIDRCVFARNTCGMRGGAAGVFAGVMSTTSCTLDGNRANDSIGGGMYVTTSGVLGVANTIVTNSHGSGIASRGGSVSDNCNDVWNNVPMDYDDVIPGSDSISLDPFYCDPILNDFRLIETSPCAAANQPVCGLIGARSANCENFPPRCDAGGPYLGTAGVPIAFDATGSGDVDGVIVFYEWFFGDGSRGSGVDPSHTYATPGQFTVTLCVRDDFGDRSCCETTADVNQIPTCDPGGPYAGNEGEPISFNAMGSGDADGQIVAYSWNFGDGSSGTGEMVSHSYASGGVFTVTLCVTDDDGSVSCCGTVSSINALPVCDAGGPYGGVPGELTVFDASSSDDPDGQINLYSWEFGDGTYGSSDQAQVVHVYEVGDVYTVTLTVHDDLDATTVCSTVADMRTFPVCDAGGPYAGGVGTAIIFDADGSDDDGEILLYEWDFGDGQTASGTFPQVVHAYEAVGQYTATVCITDDQEAESCCEAVVRVSSTTGTGMQGASAPTQLLLGHSYPNPFNPTTAIEFGLPERAHVSFRVYDTNGRVIETLVDEVRDAGMHTVIWDAGSSALPSGVYVYRVVAGGESLSKSMVLVK